ncbi:serine/threonine-protein kinase [Enhygromyxa salina]|uniref:serine/threonine-protein kinase n=1 Tax=Enhygromyxa salina TaxID=215803 RepID=UPI0015E7874E|nr:serine/threonine-protein kinase [Enhygromyxa salina]
MSELDDRTLAAPDRELSTDDTMAADAELAASVRAQRPMPALAPSIGRFSILRKLGAGGMGVVYAGYDEELDRKVAIKLLHERGQSPARRQRLLREAQGLARLSHTNVVQVYEIGEHEGAAFIAMEFVDGVTLGAWLAQRSRSRREIIQVFVQAGRGLAAAHHKDLVHRDFKPDNVMIAGDGRVVVMDFGLVHEAGSVAVTGDGAEPLDEARAAEIRRDVMSSSQIEADAIERSLRSSVLSSDLTATGAMMGTPAYMAPEQFAGGVTDGRTDQFSYAVSLWEALCGERPFAGHSVTELCTAVISGQLREPPRGADLPAYLRKILVRALATDPDNRWPSMAALLAALSVNRERRRAVALAVGAPLLLALAVGVGWQRHEQAAVAERVAACQRDSEALIEVWNDDTRAQIEAAFAATKLELAGDAWSRTQLRLSDYASEWSALRLASCRAATVEHTREPAAADRVDACLDERQAAFTSLLGLLETADAKLVQRAVQASAELPLTSQCSDDAWLAHRIELPEDPQTREQIAASRSQLEGVEVLLTTARYDQAKLAAQAALAQAEAIAWPPIDAEARYAIAIVATKLGEFAAAEPELERAFFTAGEAGHDLLALRAAISLVDIVGDELERHEEGLRWARVAAMLLARLNLTRSLEAAVLANNIGNVLENRGSYVEAQVEYERAHQLWLAAFGSEHPQIATVLNNIGVVQRRQGKLEDALATQTRALALREATLGPAHPACGDTLANLGNIYWEVGDLDQALAHGQRAHEIWLAVFGENNQKIGYALNNIGNVHFSRGELDQALDHYRRAHQVWEAALGPEHSTVAMALTNTGNVLMMKGELDEALALQRRALAVSEAASGPDSPGVAEKLNNVAVVLDAKGEHDEALALHRRALVIREQAFGAEGLETAYSLQGVGTTLTKQGHAAQALPVLERALAIREREKIAPVAIAEIRYELAKTRWALGDRELAREHGEIAEQLCRTAESPCADEVAAWLREH